MEAVRLRTQYLKNPMGIDAPAPWLFWHCQGGRYQTAFEIAARDDWGKNLWESGKVAGSAMRVQWGGSPVPPRTKVIWRIRLWDEEDVPGDWSETVFETGLDTWQARWISGNYPVNKKKRYPVDCFRKVFSTRGILKARLYITACGLYEARLNGSRVGNFVLAPGITDYRKRVQYQTYDVTDQLLEGENALTVQLGDGWYRGSCGAWGLRNQYGSQTKLLAQLEITRLDGTVQQIVTDDTWQWSNDGPIRFGDNQDGEVVDGRMAPTYGGKALVTSHPVTPTASNNVPVTEHERMTPVLRTTPRGEQVLDFGQNIAGYLTFRVQAKAGQRIFLRFGELLDKEGEFTQKNIQCTSKHKTTPLQQVEYLCHEGMNEYKTTFAIFGFQYVLVQTQVPFCPENFTAIAVYSDLERTGFFESSNGLLNQFVENTVWSAKNNHADLPTDCPTRERHGWTGDAQIFFRSAAYLFDFAAFSRKFMRDMYDWQEKNGRLPHIVPDGGADFYMRSMNGSVGWADAGVLIPVWYARMYGDDTILRELYPGMVRYSRFMERRCGKRMPVFSQRIHLTGEAGRYLVNQGQSYGEWAEPVEAGGGFRWTDFVAPHPEVSTAYTSHVLGLMAEVARHLGKEEDAREFETYSQGCRKAYQALVDTPWYPLDTDRQARLVRPLYFRLLDAKQQAFARKRLIQALEHFDWRLGTGFLSTPLILYVLAEYDLEAAYRLLENEELPGWLSMPKHGATTIWESWEGPDAQGGVASLNHYSKGAVVEWLFGQMCGIQMAGDNRFDIAPKPGGHFTHAKACYCSVYGTVESGWEKTEKGWRFTVTVPANCTAQVQLPDGTVRAQEPGTTTYEVE